MKDRVLVAMSGGIDSSVVAMLLQEQGYDLIGITFRSWDYISDGCMEKQTGCCSLDSILEAKNLAQKLNFEHIILDIREEFKNIVIENFVKEYLDGRTPNPCVVCNKFIKWGELIKKADELNCKYIATGHYANITYQNNRYILQKGIDENKDQSYFLWTLSQENLKRTLFPVGAFKKEKIKEIAAQKGFQKMTEKRESQEICFIPDNDYRRFLKEYIPNIDNQIGEGEYINHEGKILGKHKGYPFYTIGQRKGLNIAMGMPYYVTNIDAQTNRVTIGEKNQLERKNMIMKNLNFIKYDKIPDNFEAIVKIRYKDKGTMAKIINKKDYLEIIFKQPILAITPGQSAVIYEKNDIIVGGIIE